MKNIKIPGCGSPQRRGRRDLGISAEVANFAVRCAVPPLPYRGKAGQCAAPPPCIQTLICIFRH